MKRFIQFNDLKGNEHIVNMDYIVQIYTAGKYDGQCNCIGSIYYVNVANAEVACYNAEKYEVSKLVYNNIKMKLEYDTEQI